MVKQRRHYPDAAKQEDADYRAAWGIAGRKPWGRGLRAAFYAYLPDAPTGPYVTREDAAVYVGKLRDVVEMGIWPRHERERLRILLRRWEARAAGRDVRFNRLGVQGGVNDRFRPSNVGDRFEAIRHAIEESAGMRVSSPAQRWTQDAKWPLGRPV